MADPIVEPAVELVIKKVVDCLEYQYNLRSGVEGKLKKLEEVRNRIKAVANTADDLDLDLNLDLILNLDLDESKRENLKARMGELKAAVEEASDVLDEFEYLRLKRQVEDDKGPRCFPLSFEGLRSSIRQMSISSLCKCATRFVESTDLLEKLMSTKSNLDNLASNMNDEFIRQVKNREARVQQYHIQESRNRETSSSVTEFESKWVGRHDVLEEIIKLLLKEEEESVSDGKSIPFLPVVAHGGMGKTTLTKHIFNHSKLKPHFDKKMWVCVSQVFDVANITRRIIESADSNEKFSNTESLETLQQKLKSSLNKYNRFLLVLDDVWCGHNKHLMDDQWTKLCSPLAEVGGKGSKILLTSRTLKVKDLPGSLIKIILLQNLTQDECWSIIQRRALWGHENLASYEHLVPIGQKIALKVNGSPLAAQEVGGILKDQLNFRHWENILNQELSNIGESNVMPNLKLSYRNLLPPLRKCFAYCSLFPKGYKFNVDMLIRMWVAHGYIPNPTKGETTQEEIGRGYFGDLLSAGFFTRVQMDFLMPDLMNDLARFVSKNEFLCIENDGDIPDGDTLNRVRHLSVSTGSLAELIKRNCNLSNLQSLLLIGHPLNDLEDNLVKDLFHQLKRVRVLDLNLCPVKQLPDDIDRLVHLRYLDVSYTDITSLPESFWRLYHLQVMRLPRFNASPQKLNHLVKLRYLSSINGVKLSWIKGLKSLQMVRSDLVVEKGRGGEISNLKALNELREKLVLKNLDYVERGAAAREAELRRKKWLKSLKLHWGGYSACSPDMAAEVLEGLQPPSSLERLEIWSYPGMALPNWTGHTSLNKLENDDIEEWSGRDGRGRLPCLKVLRIIGCTKLKALPTLSLILTELIIENVGLSSLPGLDDPNIPSSSSSNGIISSPSKLSKLTIEDCENLTSLGEGLLQNHQRLMDLEEVTIRSCKLLVSLPDRGFREFKSLKRLLIEDCPKLRWVAPNQDLDRGLLPPSLEELSLSHLVLVDETLCLQGLTSLQKLSIRRCQSLTPSALEDLQALPSLKKLKMEDWPALTPSALEALQGLASLKKLKIYECPGLLLETSSTSTADDGEGMARGPFSLAIDNLDIDNPLMLIKVPVLKSLTSVHRVIIRDASQLVSFSPELEKWFLQNGTSLRRLIIWEARELQALPDLPKSLEFLYIWRSNEEFQTRYERDIGPDWHKIQHIKHVYIE